MSGLRSLLASIAWHSVWYVWLFDGLLLAVLVLDRGTRLVREMR